MKGEVGLARLLSATRKWRPKWIQLVELESLLDVEEGAQEGQGDGLPVHGPHVGDGLPVHDEVNEARGAEVNIPLLAWEEVAGIP